MLIGCDKLANSLLEALKKCGFIDENGKVHNWNEHNGYHESYSERAKKAAAARYACPPPDESKFVCDPPLASPPNPETVEGEGKGKEKESGVGMLQATKLSMPAKSRASCEEIVKAFCLELGLPETDGEWFFAKCEGCGWTNSGKPIKDWKATLRAWKAQGYVPSMKSKTNGHAVINGLSGADKVSFNNELERINAKIHELNVQYGGHQTWDARDITLSNNLKARRREIKEKLGVKY